MIYFALILAVLVIAVIVERLLAGKHIESLLINKPIKVNEQAHIYLDGKYNRTATINRIEAHRLFIYDKLPLHIAHRGRFYATGRTADGRSLIYVANRNHYYYVRLAELLRIIFAIADNAYMLEPTTDEDPIGDALDNPAEEEDEE